jgi:hypothetical protein
MDVKTASMDDKTASMDDKTASTFGTLKIISWGCLIKESRGYTSDFVEGKLRFAERIRRAIKLFIPLQRQRTEISR